MSHPTNAPSLHPLIILLLAAAPAAAQCGSPGTGGCGGATATPYCEDTDCCEAVCAADEFCCNVEWDSICAADGAAMPECGPRVTNVTAATQHVNIQDAVLLASDGDVIELDDGGYTGLGNVNVDLVGRSVTLRSAGGDAASCILDAQNVSGVRGLIMDQGEHVTVQGVTIRNGSADTGGGIHAPNAVLVLESCIIEANDATGPGGGVLAGAGGTIENTTFRQNQAGGDGGGVAVAGGALTVRGSQFIDNAAVLGGDGGGVHVGGGAALTLHDTLFRDNDAGRGGGVAATGGTMQIASSRFEGNTAGDGAAVHVDGGGTIVATSIVLFENAASGIGGGMLLAGGAAATIVNGTLCGNGGGGVGGVLARDAGTTLEVVNSILWNDAGVEIATIDGAAATAAYSTVQGGFAGDHVLAADPLFFDAPAGDLRVQNGSPVVNRGTHLAPGICSSQCAPPAGPETCVDVDGLDRVQQCRVDMGAHESSNFHDCNGNGVSDACDIAPIYGATCTTFDDLVYHLPGDAGAETPSSAITITGNDCCGGPPTVAWVELPLDLPAAVVEFDLGYTSAGTTCPGGSNDYPVFHVNGVFHGINADGTIAGPIDGTCTGGGTIGNGTPVAALRVVADLEALAGPGPYMIGFGVHSVDNGNGAGVVTISGLRAVNDRNMNDVPDDCDCPSDTNLDFEVDVSDLVNVVLDWGSDGAAHNGDVDDTGAVDVEDLVQVILEWGGCG